MEGRVLRRSVTLADQLAAVGPAPAGPCNLRDLLKLRDEDNLTAGRRAAVTLASPVAAERQASSPARSSSAAAAAAAARTLLDIIRDDGEFVNCVRCIRILSPQEVQQMSLDGDLGNNILPNQACSSSDGGNAWRARCHQNDNPSTGSYDQFD